MPLFQRNHENLSLIKPQKFFNEKELQWLIEKNLVEIFNCRFVATEFSTGPVHGGRIDSLALSEENNPVIIEYKVVESSQLINQSLYYLSWIQDHHGDFEIAVQKAFSDEIIEIDWSDIRVICVAPGYKKYDLHAVQMMGSNIELWQYRYYGNGAFFLEEIYKRTIVSNHLDKNPIMVEAGKKAAITRATAVYSVSQHREKIDNAKLSLVDAIQDFILNLDESIEEVPKKYYVAYKVSQNFVCMVLQKMKIVLYLKIDPEEIQPLPRMCRDMRNIDHFGTGNLELTILEESDLDVAYEFIQKAFDNVGGN